MRAYHREFLTISPYSPGPSKALYLITGARTLIWSGFRISWNDIIEAISHLYRTLLEIKMYILISNNVQYLSALANRITSENLGEKMAIIEI